MARRILGFCLTLIACSPGPVTIEGVRFYDYDPPADTKCVLKLSRTYISEHDLPDIHDSYVVPLTDSIRDDYRRRYGVEIAGLAWPSEGKIALLETDSIFDTSLLHELYQHMLPWLLDRNPNASHAQEWKTLENMLSLKWQDECTD